MAIIRLCSPPGPRIATKPSYHHNRLKLPRNCGRKSALRQFRALLQTKTWSCDRQFHLPITGDAEQCGLATIMILVSITLFSISSHLFSSGSIQLFRWCAFARMRFWWAGDGNKGQWLHSGTILKNQESCLGLQPFPGLWCIVNFKLLRLPEKQIPAYMDCGFGQALLEGMKQLHRIPVDIYHPENGHPPFKHFQHFPEHFAILLDAFLCPGRAVDDDKMIRVFLHEVGQIHPVILAIKAVDGASKICQSHFFVGLVHIRIIRAGIHKKDIAVFSPESNSPKQRWTGFLPTPPFAAANVKILPFSFTIITPNQGVSGVNQSGTSCGLFGFVVCE